MLSIVIVPRNAIVFQKREELVAVLPETLGTGYCRRALIFTIHVFAVEANQVTQIFSQKVGLEISSVDLFHDAFTGYFGEPPFQRLARRTVDPPAASTVGY